MDDGNLRVLVRKLLKFEKLGKKRKKEADFRQKFINLTFKSDFFGKFEI